MFDPEVYFLGKLCPRGHSFPGTEKSLRYRSTGRCVRCEVLRARLYYDDQMKIMARDPEMAKDYRERKNANSRNHYEARKTDPKFHVGRLRQKNQRRRTAQNGNHNYKASPAELEERWELFGHACAYCGSTERLTIDHVRPVTQSGPHVIGNLVPCCRKCNSSKKDLPVEEWYKKQTFYSEHAWRRIQKLSSLDGDQLQVC